MDCTDPSIVYFPINTSFYSLLLYCSQPKCYSSTSGFAMSLLRTCFNNNHKPCLFFIYSISSNHKYLCLWSQQSGFSSRYINLWSSNTFKQDPTRTLWNFLRTAYEDSMPKTKVNQISIRQVNIHSHICSNSINTSFFFSSLCNNSFFFHSFSFSSSFSLLLAEISISSLVTSSWRARHWRTWNK